MLRYWDGQQWTEHRSPVVASPTSPSQQLTPPGSAAPWREPERPTATAAFICAIIGAVIGLIPLLGILAIPLGLIGLILGIMGWRRKPQRAKLAPAATILGTIAVGLGIVGIVIVANIFDEVDEAFNPDLDPSPNPPAAVIAEYGTDAELDRLADQCAGSGEEAAEACSDLWAQAPVGSGYEDYGGSCGERPDRDGFMCSRD